ncbi:hypothetical protein FGG08_000295 [Glutinoglossum americanum]|uniref:Zinc transporter n=1 Tax=Glutinoglossum americanum TaxID=1670608 RepID=A0A9P8IFQ7_9PEZI|nr:hypothetical protein FGG08_000295 [Glutinoglossum americanum]
MASGLPLPVPPRTPTPPPEDQYTASPDLNGSPPMHADPIYDPNALSPIVGSFDLRFNSMASAMSASPSSVNTMKAVDGFDVGGTSNRPASSGNPFNFQTTTLSKSPVIKSNVVDVLGNFEVWKRSSIRHPFGLERAEVLAGFAMSVFLLFMGMDLISHNLQHVLEHVGHEPQIERRHQRVSPGSVDLASLLAIISTLVSAIGLKNHARIGKAMRFAYISSLPSVLSNPSHFLTLSCSALLLLLPLLSVEMYIWLDRLLSTTIAVSMCILGFRLVKTLGFMLLMSYSGSGVSDVMREIENDPAVNTVEEARFWQVHYGLCMANLKLRVHGSEDTVTRLRERVTSLIRNRLGGGYGSGGQRWEVSMQMLHE